MIDGSADRRSELALLLAVALLFSEAWLGTRVFYHRDLLGYWYPQMEVVRRLAGEGAWPWWNPFLAFGAPLFADPNLQLAYPPTWLALAMPPAAYFKLYVIGHGWLAALGARGLARRLGGSQVAADLAGVVYACSGPLLSSVSLFHHFAGAAWMPAVLWALLRAAETGTFRAALWLGCIAAAQALAGSADLCLMTALAGLLLIGLGLPGRLACGWRGLLRVLGVSVPFAAALAAVQWLPALALLSDSARPSLAPASSLYWSLHPARVLDAFVPRLLADLPLGGAARAALFESREPLLASLYLGVPAAVLAALGVAGRVAWGRWLAAGLVFFVLLALGRHGPVLPLLLELPPFGLFRYPEKYALPASLFFSILAARGADAWLAHWDARERRLGALAALGALALALAVLLLAGWASEAPESLVGVLDPPAAPGVPGAMGLAVQRLQRTGLALVGCAALLLLRRRASRAMPTAAALGLALVADLVLAGRDVNPLAPAAALAYRPPVLSALRGNPDAWRVFSDPDPVSWLNRQFTAETWGGDARVAWALGNVDRLVAPGAERFGLRGSYDGDFTGLANPNLHAMGSILQRYEATALGPRLLRMGNVGFVVGLQEEAFGLPPEASFPSVFRVPVRVYRVPEPLPPAYVVDGVHVAREPRSFEVMAAATFDPRREAVVAGGLEARAPGEAFRGSAQVVSRRADRVVVDARLSAPGLLVLVEAWDRGWSVQVDGEPAPLLRANVLFRGVALPAGRHVVSFSYFPRFLVPGAAASLAAVLLAVAAAVFGRRAARRVEGSEPWR